MAKIYLLSGGNKLKGMLSKEQEALLKIDLKGKSNLVSIGSKREYEKNDTYFYGDNQMMGVKETFSFSDLKDFKLIDGRITKEDGLNLLEKADIIYLQGGDPFVQLKYIVDNGYEIFLRDYKGIILGLSAGSMNLGENCFYSKDCDYSETVFYEGLGLTDLVIDPHFDINNLDRVEEAKKGSYEFEIIGLPDYSTIIIDQNKKVTEIGPNYKYRDGNLVNSIL